MPTRASVLPNRTRIGELVAKGVLAVAAASFTYAAADLAAGYFLIKRLSPPIVPDPLLHHRLEPNTFSRFTSPDFDYTQRVNNLGLRGPDINPVKRKTSYRILMLGDSFTMGLGVHDDETFSARLEQSLNAKGVTVEGRTVEVLNAGVKSYAPILYFLQLTKRLAGLSPDLVVLNLDMSDLAQETAFRSEATYGSDGEVIAVSGRKDERKRPASRRARIKAWINQHLYFTRLAVFYVEGAIGEPDVAKPTVENTFNVVTRITIWHTLAADTVDRTQEWRNLFDSIVRIRDYCHRKRIEFLLTLYPWGHQVNDREWVPGRGMYIPAGAAVSDRSIHAVREFASQANIELLDVVPAFRSYEDTVPLYFKHDAHWTPQGHRLMAEQLEQFLTRKFAGR
ncbi:MAG TPA: SGNH/GDSL hydrolase family protein [Gemmatimonadales bacterium]|nr:SGNH/GDSL hydrolase family protein [Gemmatimonadales bacterium]